MSLTYMTTANDDGDVLIGYIDQQSIEQGKLYPVCKFPSAPFNRRLLIGGDVRMFFNAVNTLEFVSGDNQVVFSFRPEDDIVHDWRILDNGLSVIIPAYTGGDTDSLSVRWVDEGGNYSVYLNGRITIYDASQVIEWAESTTA